MYVHQLTNNNMKKLSKKPNPMNGIEFAIPTIKEMIDYAKTFFILYNVAKKKME